MSSIQTEYRKKRIDLVKGMLLSLIDLTQLKKKELEKIPLPKLKQLSREIEELKLLEKADLSGVTK